MNTGPMNTGPMSPVPLAPNAFEVTTAIPLAPPSPIPLPAALPEPAVTTPVAVASTDPVAGEVPDVVKPRKKRRSQNAASDSPGDSDHMASTLNRMQLSGSGAPEARDRGPYPAAGD
jgi:hypothetical protein